MLQLCVFGVLIAYLVKSNKLLERTDTCFYQKITDFLFLLTEHGYKHSRYKPCSITRFQQFKLSFSNNMGKNTIDTCHALDHVVQHVANYDFTNLKSNTIYNTVSQLCYTIETIFFLYNQQYASFPFTSKSCPSLC